MSENEEPGRIDTLEEENTQLRKRITELTALLYQASTHFEERHFNSAFSAMEDQNIARVLRSKIVMTPEVWAIVNRSKEQSK